MDLRGLLEFKSALQIIISQLSLSSSYSLLLYIDGGMDGCMDEWMYVWMDGWMDGWMNGWMDGWQDR